jgi:hypothetical protein
MELYFFGPDLVHRLMTGDAPDHVTVCHSGHGINSYMITYCLVYRGLVLLTQVGWGGVYMNKEVQRQALAKVFQGCQALIDRLEARGGAPTAARERRLVCLDSAGRRVATCRWVRTEEVDRRSPAQPVERGTALAVADGLLREE